MEGLIIILPVGRVDDVEVLDIHPWLLFLGLFEPKSGDELLPFSQDSGEWYHPL